MDGITKGTNSKVRTFFLRDSDFNGIEIRSGAYFEKSTEKGRTTGTVGGRERRIA